MPTKPNNSAFACMALATPGCFHANLHTLISPTRSPTLSPAIVPGLGYCSSLTKLDASSNRLTGLDPSLLQPGGLAVSLSELNLSSNAIRALPDEFGALSKLKVLVMKVRRRRNAGVGRGGEEGQAAAGGKSRKGWKGVEGMKQRLGEGAGAASPASVLSDTLPVFHECCASASSALIRLFVPAINPWHLSTTQAG